MSRRLHSVPTVMVLDVPPDSVADFLQRSGCPEYELQHLRILVDGKERRGIVHCQRPQQQAFGFNGGQFDRTADWRFARGHHFDSSPANAWRSCWRAR